VNLHEPKHILIIDDEDNMRWILKRMLEKEGYYAYAFATTTDALTYIRRHGVPHLALIDIGLSTFPGDTEGFTFSEELKRMGDIPIIFVSAKDDPDLIVHGLDRFAEDYVSKPFNQRELMARIRRVLKRFPDTYESQAPEVQIDDWLSINFAQNKVFAGHEEHSLTPTEASLLHILIRNAGRTIPAEMFIARVWSSEEIYGDTLRVHMHRLRRKIEPDHQNPRYILTVRGVGYRFFSPASQETLHSSPHLHGSF